MDNNVIEKFVISMSSRNMKPEEIANTVNISEDKVRKIINDNKSEILKKKQQIENAGSVRLHSMSKKGRRGKKQNETIDEKTDQTTNKIIKEELLKSQEKIVTTKTLANLLEIKSKIMRGEEYNKEKFKRLENRIIVKSYSRPNNQEIEELAQIYVQLGAFTRAKAVVREAYEGVANKTNSDRIISGIRKQELSYKIMKYYRMGLSASQMAEELRLYTVDVIKGINKQKDINIKIKEMHKEGINEVDIAELLHENIERVKWGIESKEKDKPKSYGGGKDNKSEVEGDER